MGEWRTGVLAELSSEKPAWMVGCACQRLCRALVGAGVSRLSGPLCGADRAGMQEPAVVSHSQGNIGNRRERDGVEGGWNRHSAVRVVCVCGWESRDFAGRRGFRWGVEHFCIGWMAVREAFVCFSAGEEGRKRFATIDCGRGPDWPSICGVAGSESAS